MESIAIVLWLAVTAGIRIRYLLAGNIVVTDQFKYFEAAMIQAEKQEPILSSGIAYAYSKSLSMLFWFTGNRLNIVAVYQTVMQMLTIVLLFFALRLLFGKAVAFFAGAVLSVLPMLIESVGFLSPENFFLLNLAFALFLIACFYQKTDREKQRIGAGSILYIIFVGIYMGMVFTLHFFGFLLLPVLIFALFQSRLKYEKKEIICQSLLWTAGAGCGIFVSLLSTTRITGMEIRQQWNWWTAQIDNLSGTVYQDLEIRLLLWVVGAVLLGIIFQLIWNKLIQAAALKKEKTAKKEQQEESTETENPVMGKEEKMEEKQWDEIKKEEKKINYIENPLPLPKPHVARHMDFEKTGQADDFDFEVSETDDFDI